MSNLLRMVVNAITVHRLMNCQQREEIQSNGRERATDQNYFPLDVGIQGTLVLISSVFTDSSRNPIFSVCFLNLVSYILNNFYRFKTQKSHISAFFFFYLSLSIVLMIDHQAQDDQTLNIYVEHRKGPCCELLAQWMTCAPSWKLKGWERHCCNPL